MPQTYLPTREAQLVTWTGEFLANIQAAPAAYGLLPQQATEYATTRTRFVDAYNKVQNPITRTPPNVAAKNAAKKTLVNATRMLVDVVQAWPQMTNQKRRELKITERGRKPTPTPVPGMPFVKVVSVNGREVTLSIQQSKTTRRRPNGVLGANVMAAYGGEAAPAAAPGWNFVTATGRTTVALTLDGAAEACTAWVTAFWFNGRKETGPAATPIPVALPALNAVAPAMKIKRAA